MPDQKYTLDPTITAGNLLTAVLPIAQGGLDYKVTPQLLQGNLNNAGAAFTVGSVIFAGAGGLFAEDNSNFFWNSASHILSVNTAGDTTGVDSINVYNEIDAYKPNSTQGAIGSGTESGITASSSRGTGTVPLVLSSGDLVGGFSGWGYTNSVPAYEALGGIWIKASGASSDLGGQLELWTKADNGALTQRVIIDNTGLAAFNGRATFTATTTLPGVNVGSFAGNPSTLANGDIWYNSSIAGWMLRTNGQLGFLAYWISGLSVNRIPFAAQSTRGDLNGSVNFTYDTKTLTVGGAAQSSGASSFAIFTGRADTGITTATEQTDMLFDLSASKTWVDGTVTTQRDIWVKGRTYNKTTTSAVFTNGYTFYIDAPTAGTGVTITNNWGLGVQTGLLVQDTAKTKNLLSVTTGGALVTWSANGVQILTNGSGVGGISLNGTAPISNNFIITSGFQLTNVNASYSATAFNIVTGTGAANNSSATASFLNIQSRFSGTSTAAFNFINVDSSTIVNSTASGAVTFSSFAPVITAHAGIVTGYDWNPSGTFTNVTTHLAWRNTSGNVLIGATTITANYMLDVRGNVNISPAANASGNNVALNLTGPAQTGGAGNYIAVFTGGAHTGLTAATESTDVLFSLARTVTITAGSLMPFQRFIRMVSSTINFSAGSSITDAATLSVDGATIKGANASITNTHGILITSGNVGAATNSYALTANAMTGATNNYSAQFLNGLFLISQSSLSTSHTFITFTQSAHTGGTPLGLLFTGGAHTSLTLSVESNDLKINLARTVQFATGALTTQRAIYITAPTYGFVGASTITNAYTFYIDQAPVVGTNATITNSYAAGFGGNVALLTAGNKFFIKEGTNGSMGQVALVAGTKAISISGVTTSSRAFVELVTPNTASSTIQYKAVCTAGTLTITALLAAGTINNVDVSTLNYIIFEPTP